MGKTTKFTWLTRTALAGVLIAAPFVSNDAYAQSQPREFHLNIPSQPLSEALRAYAQATGQQIVFSEDLVAGRSAPALSGDYSAEAALERLLEGSGLVVVRTPRGGVMVLAADDPRADASSPTRLGAADEAGPSDEEEIVITGTNIRGAPPVGAPVITVTAEALASHGRVQDFFETVPQNFAGSASEDANRDSGVNNLTRGQAIDLRGLGASSTLVLVNGRRQPAGGAWGAFVDISSIPTAAVERVEILTDGASAIYGSDAIGGVVNFILREDYSGAELSA